MHGLPPFGLPLLCRPDGGSFLVFRCTIGFVAMVFRCTIGFVAGLGFVAGSRKIAADTPVTSGRFLDCSAATGLTRARLVLASKIASRFSRSSSSLLISARFQTWVEIFQARLYSIINPSRRRGCPVLA